MNELFCMHPYCCDVLPAVDYSLKRPYLYVASNYSVEIYRLGFLKIIGKIAISQPLTTMMADYQLLFVTFGYELAVFYNAARIASVQLDIAPKCQILRAYRQANENLSFRQDVYLFDYSLCGIKVSGAIQEFNGVFLLGNDDFEIEYIDAPEDAIEDAKEVHSIALADGKSIIYAGNRLYIFDCNEDSFIRRYSIVGDDVVVKAQQSNHQSDQIIRVSVSTEHSNVAVVILPNRAIFLNLKEDATKLKLLQLNSVFAELRDVILTRNILYAYFDDKCYIFDLKAKALVNSWTLHNRHVGNQLFAAIPITITGEIRDDEMAFLAISRYHLQFYVTNILKMEHIIPGDIDYLFFRDGTTTYHFDQNLRFVSVNVASRRVLITMQDYKYPDVNFSLENQNFSFSEITLPYLHQKSMFGIVKSSGDQVCFRFDLTTGAYTFFNAPGGRTRMSYIILSIRHDISMDKTLTGKEKDEMVSDLLARNEYCNKFGTAMDNSDVIRSYNVACGMIVLVSRYAVGCYYVYTGNLVFEEKLEFEPLCCYIGSVSNQAYDAQFHFTADLTFEIFALFFDDYQFVVFDAVKGRKVCDGFFNAYVATILGYAENIYVVGELVVLNGYDTLAIVKATVSSSAVCFSILRDEKLLGHHVTRNYLVRYQNRLYYSHGRKLMFFDIPSAGLFVIHEFDRQIRHFDVQDGIFAVSFYGLEGVYFYCQKAGNLGERVTKSLVADLHVENCELKGEKMLHYLSLSKNSLRKVYTRRKKVFARSETKDFLKEEDVLFLGSEEVLALLRAADPYEQLGVFLLLGALRGEILGGAEIKPAIAEARGRLQALVSHHERAYETCRSIAEEFL